MKKLWIKIRVRLELWADAIERWFDVHVRVVSKRAIRNLVQERDMLRDALDELEDESSSDFERLTNENEYLKGELAILRVERDRLSDMLEDKKDRDYRDIFPGLQAENKQLQAQVKELKAKLDEVLSETTSEDS